MRHCCLCRKQCGTNIEAAHIVDEAAGGSNDDQNGIPLCFDCHQEIGAYRDSHPKGNKFTPNELRSRRDKVYELVQAGQIRAEPSGAAIAQTSPAAGYEAEILASLAKERFRKLHEQFLEAAQTYPNLFFAAAVPVHPEATLWTETLAKVGGIWCRFPGLEACRWYELLDKPFYPLKPVCDRWLSMEGQLWHGIFYGPPPKLRPNGQENEIAAEHYRKVCESGIELFDSLARQSAAYCGVPSAPEEIFMALNRYQARLAFHDCQRVENRWLEKLCNLPSVRHIQADVSMFKPRKRVQRDEATRGQEYDRYWEAYKLRRVPCDVFSASAMAMESFFSGSAIGSVVAARGN
jgi:hypothetical protein